MSSFKGEFIRSTSRKLGVPIVSFVLTNKNWFTNETIRILISDVTGTKQQSLTIETKNGKAYTFNSETIGWDWAQDDFFAILNKKGNVIQKWIFHIDTNKPCPHCFGTKKCKACNGEGYALSANYQISMCIVCHGTGICQYCYVPVRKLPLSYNTSYRSTTKKGRSIAEIQGDIRKAEFELERVNRMLLEYELRRDYGTFYSSQKQYALSLEHRIKDLYNEMSQTI